MSKTQVSVRLDSEVLQQLENLAADRGVDRADVLRDAANEYAQRHVPVMSGAGGPAALEVLREDVIRRIYDLRSAWHAPASRPGPRDTGIMVNWIAGLLVDVESLTRGVEPWAIAHSEPGSEAARTLQNTAVELDRLSRPLWNAARTFDATLRRPYVEIDEPATITVSIRSTDNGPWREIRRHPDIDNAFDVVARAAFPLDTDLGIDSGTTVRVAVLDEEGQIADSYTLIAQ